MRRASRCVVLHGERVWAHQVVSVSNSSVSCRQGADSGQGPPCAQVSLNSTVPAPGAECKVAGARADRGEFASCNLPHLSMGADTGFALSAIVARTQHQIQAPFRCGPAFTSPCTSSCAALFQPQAGRTPVSLAHPTPSRVLARVLWWSPGEGPRRSRRYAPALPSRRNTQEKNT